MHKTSNGKEEKKNIAMHSTEIKKGCASIGEIVDLMRK